MSEESKSRAKAAAEALEFLTRGKHMVAVFLAQLGMLFGVFYLLRRFSSLDPMVCATISAATTILTSGGALWMLINRFAARAR